MNQDKLKDFAALVLKWSPKINLVSKSDLNHIWERHVEDSLRLLPYIPQGTPRAIDLGSGAGFPGLVLCIATGIPFDLIESDARKAAFNVTVRGSHHTGQILDLSVAGMACRFDGAVHLRPHEAMDDVQLRLRGTLCRVAGGLVGSPQGGEDRLLMMFRAPLPDDVRAKIHRFIFLSLQEEMGDFIRGLKA